MKWLGSFWRFLWRPYVGLPFLVLVGGGLIVGAAGVGAIIVALDVTSTNAFCVSCHTHDAAPEWRQSFHYANKLGFVAGCSDCHESRAFIPKVMRKLQAGVDEGLNQLLGTISTPQKYEAHRLALAEKVWASLRRDNSQECRNCHELSAMADPATPSIREMHEAALSGGRTCIDCHKGVAHKAPSETQ